MILLHKNIEHHIERHYEFESDKNIYLQQVHVSETFYSDKLKHCLSIYEDSLFYNDLWENYSNYDSINDFDFLKSSSFYSFFNHNKIDIPKCFKYSTSLRRSSNQVTLLKFSNYLMRHGDRNKYLKFLVKFLWKFFEDLKFIKLKPYRSYNNWKDVYIALSSLSFNKVNYGVMSFKSEEALTFGHKFLNTSKEIGFDWNIRNLIFKNLQYLSPIFSFYIYKVDKKIFKNTRGKSGKYTFIWKYVSPFKRLFLVMQWLMKELKLKPGKTLSDRLYTTLNTLILSPDKTWIYRVKKFSHNYVYRNSRRTLAESYRTVTK